MTQVDEEESPLPADEEAALLTALVAAWRPDELDPGVNERLLEMALEDPLAAPSEEELIESARLRDALEQALPHADASLLQALGAPFTTPHIVSPEQDQVVQRALAGALAGAVPVPTKRTNVIYATFGAAGAALAVAAAALLFFGVSRQAPRAGDVAFEPSAFVKPRSTAPMFAERFETGDTTARMDLIVSARSRDLRDNRYTAWGVQ